MKGTCYRCKAYNQNTTMFQPHEDPNIRVWICERCAETWKKRIIPYWREYEETGKIHDWNKTFAYQWRKFIQDADKL